jgi:hypothetical protein
MPERRQITNGRAAVFGAKSGKTRLPTMDDVTVFVTRTLRRTASGDFMGWPL